MENSPSGLGSFIQNNAVPLSVLVAGVLIAVAILISGSGGGSDVVALGDGSGDGQPVIVDTESLVDDDPMLGDPNAEITIVEFSDFQCPFCRKFFTDTYPELKTKYIDTGIVNLVFRDFPLSFHSAARPSAIAAECADDQGKYWEYHDKLFIEQAKQGSGTISYGIPELKQWAREIGLDEGSFDSCLDSEKYGSEVDADFEDAQAVGVSGTPSFFVDGTLLVGAQPISAFEQAIEAARQ